jgi:hypothetical protein
MRKENIIGPIAGPQGDGSMKKMNHIAILLLIGVLLSFLCIPVSVSATPADSVWHDGDYEFQNLEDGARLIKYSGNETDVEIPATTEYKHVVYPVKIIERDAFRQNLSIQTLTVSNNVVRINDTAFEGCLNLRRVQLGTRVEHIGTDAFSNTGITDIIIPKTLKVCSSAFRNCPDFTSVTIASGATVVPAALCNECTALKNVSISSSVQTINENAFYGCTSLKNVSMGSAVHTIKANAFYGCASLTSINFPSSLIRLESDAFHGSGLKEVTLPAKMQETGGAPFRNCLYLQKATIKSGAKIIPNSLFFECRALRSVSIPSTVTAIGAQAFENCINLSKISIPSGVTSIAGGAFRGCSSLSSVVLPNALESLDASVFAETILESVTIPKSLKVVSGSTSPFVYCHYLKSATFKSGRDTIPANIFKDCVALQSVTIPDTVKVIDAAAFSGCIRLTNVTLPSGLKIINSGAFYDCDSITSIALPSSLERVGANAFSGTAIRSISLPKKLQLDSTSTVSAFVNCFYLKKAVFKSGTKQISPYMFKDCTALQEVTIPTTVNEVGAYAFDGCINLKKVTYSGKRAQWRKVLVNENGNEALKNVKCSDTPSDGTNESGELIWNADGVVLKGSTYYVYQNGKNKGKYTGWIKKGAYKVYVEKGKISTKTGLVKIKSIRYYIKKGYFQRNYTGLLKYSKKYWYIFKGKVNTSYKGLVSYDGKLWYVQNGKWNNSFNGTVKYNKKSYTVKNGIAQ